MVTSDFIKPVRKVDPRIRYVHPEDGNYVRTVLICSPACLL